MSAKQARRALADVAVQMRVTGLSYVDAARVQRDERDYFRSICDCNHCRALRGARVLR